MSEILEQLEGVKKDLSTQQEKSIKEAVAPVTKSIEDLTTTANDAKKVADETAATVKELNVKLGEMKGSINTEPTRAKSFNELLADGLDNHAKEIEAMAKGRSKGFTFDMKAVGDMGMGNYTGGTNFITDAGRPQIIAPPVRKLHIRNIPELVKGTMTGGVFPYLKGTGGEGAFTTVAENAVKPQLDEDLVEATAQAEFIAGWMKISKKMLQDVNGLISYLQNRLLERLLLAEDIQLISGDGVSPNLSGITTAGNFTAASGAATVDIEQLVQAISQLEELGREANAIVLRPSDFYNLALNKASGSGEYDLPGIVTVDNNGILRVLGVPVYKTTGIAVDKFIVGDFANGALLLQREAPIVEFFDQNENDAKYNKIMIRVEERIAFPIFGSDYFIYGDFGNV